MLIVVYIYIYIDYYLSFLPVPQLLLAVLSFPYKSEVSPLFPDVFMSTL